MDSVRPPERGTLPKNETSGHGLSEMQHAALMRLFDTHQILVTQLDSEQWDSIRTLQIVERYVNDDIARYVDEKCGPNATVFSRALVRSEFIAEESWYHDDWNCIFLQKPEDLAHELYHFIEVKIWRVTPPEEETRIRAAEERLVPIQILKNTLMIGSMAIAVLVMQDTQSRIQAVAALVAMNGLLTIQYNKHKNRVLRAYASLTSEVNAEKSKI